MSTTEDRAELDGRVHTLTQPGGSDAARHFLNEHGWSLENKATALRKYAPPGHAVVVTKLLERLGLAGAEHVEKGAADVEVHKVTKRREDAEITLDALAAVHVAKGCDEFTAMGVVMETEDGRRLYSTIEKAKAEEVEMRTARLSKAARTESEAAEAEWKKRVEEVQVRHGWDRHTAESWLLENVESAAAVFKRWHGAEEDIRKAREQALDEIGERQVKKYRDQVVVEEAEVAAARKAELDAMPPAKAALEKWIDARIAKGLDADVRSNPEGRKLYNAAERERALRG